MKQLVLLRHGKSDWSAGTGDHARPLAPRGVQAAGTMGKLLAQAGQAPDHVVTSSAVRAHTTAELAADAGGWDAAIEVDRTLYMAGPAEVLDVVRRTSADVDSLLLVGHQPTWSDVAELLTSANVRVATATAVGIHLDVDAWPAVAPRRGILAWVLPPRLFEWLA
jgi:phosphohistidine phosphatase